MTRSAVPAQLCVNTTTLIDREEEVEAIIE
jgi:hypothetical protein